MNYVFKKNIYFAMVDIDGTIKDLVKENTNALIRTMEFFDNINLKFRGRFVLFINKINMFFVKTGLLPTNKLMLNILLFIYSVMLLKRFKKFKSKYFEEYNKEHIFFEKADEIINSINHNHLTIYMVTKNRQNKYIAKVKDVGNNFKCINSIYKIVVGKRNTIKYTVYKSLMQKNGIKKNELVIIGDNFWDDILPAMLLGVKVIWCNMYNSNLKKSAINILKLFNKNIYDYNDIKKYKN